VGIGPSKTAVDAALVEAAHAFCLDVHPYTVNETAEMEALIALGVDGMLTNFPDRLEELLGKGAAGANRTGSLVPKTTQPAAPPLREERSIRNAGNQ
jgi:glycerophosphoryl diester phosphodiesterase